MSKDKRKVHKRLQSRSRSASRERSQRSKSKRSNDYSTSFNSGVEELHQRFDKLRRRQRSWSTGSSRQNRNEYDFNTKRRQRSWNRSPRAAITVRGSRSPAGSLRVRSSSHNNIDCGSRSPTRLPTYQVAANAVLSQSPPPVEISSPAIVPTVSLAALDLSKNVKACLGEDPEINIAKLSEPHPELVKPINYILAKGLDKEVKMEILSKYPIPKSVNMGAPAHNPEIAASIGPVDLANGKYHVNIQDDFGQGIGCVMLAVNKMVLDDTSLIPKTEYIQRQDCGEKIKAVKTVEMSAKQIATIQGRPGQLLNQSSRPLRTQDLNSFHPSRCKPRDHRQQGQFSENTNPRYRSQRDNQAHQTKRSIR